MLTGQNGILKRAAEAKEKTNQSNKDEEDTLQEMVDAINNVSPSSEGYVESKKVDHIRNILELPFCDGMYYSTFLCPVLSRFVPIRPVLSSVVTFLPHRWAIARRMPYL